MATQAVPSRFTRNGQLKIVPSDEGLWLECEVTHPPSNKGRTVYVYFDEDAVTKMLIECRASGIRARSQPAPP